MYEFDMFVNNLEWERVNIAQGIGLPTFNYKVANEGRNK